LSSFKSRRLGRFEIDLGQEFATVKRCYQKAGQLLAEDSSLGPLRTRGFELEIPLDLNFVVGF